MFYSIIKLSKTVVDTDLLGVGVGDENVIQKISHKASVQKKNIKFQIIVLHFFSWHFSYELLLIPPISTHIKEHISIYIKEDVVCLRELFLKDC